MPYNFRQMPKLSPKEVARVRSKVVKSDSGKCWEWSGWCNPAGYGAISIHNTTYLAHRLAYSIHYGVDPEELFVCHACDNPRCCNPYHLWLGTAKDNTHDSIKKGRRKASHSRRGDTSPRHTLTEKQVKVIKRAQMTPHTGIGTALGKKFNVLHQVISDIKTGKVWSHVHV